MRKTFSSTRRNVEPPDTRALKDKGISLAAADAATAVSTYFSIRAEKEWHLPQDVVDAGLLTGRSSRASWIMRIRSGVLYANVPMNLEPAVGDMTEVASGTRATRAEMVDTRSCSWWMDDPRRSQFYQLFCLLNTGFGTFGRFATPTHSSAFVQFRRVLAAIALST